MRNLVVLSVVALAIVNASVPLKVSADHAFDHLRSGFGPKAGCGHHHDGDAAHHAAQLRRSLLRKMMNEPSGSSRHMHPQTVQWRPLRITFNYTYADTPALDRYPSGTPATCQTVGQELLIGGQSAPQPVFCFNPQTGAREYASYCTLVCNTSDILNSADLPTLKTVNSAVGQTFNELLSVELLNEGRISFSANPNNGVNCGQMSIPPQTVDTDLVVYVTVRPLRHMGSTIAFASSCDLHPSSNRPILAHMNVAPKTLAENPDLRTVILHELTHALGFTPSLFPFYRHPANNSQTYWEYDNVTYPTGPISGDGINDQGRGTFDVSYTGLGPGRKLYLKTPNLIQYARQFFNCSTIDGVELENGGNSAASTGSHWEKRILYYEYMTATQNVAPGVVSGFTLALFSDMGFYTANMSGAQDMAWGKGLGCAWATGPCSNWTDAYFCRAQPGRNQDGCGYDGKFFGSCNLQRYVQDLPAAYQWFPGEPTLGGEDEYPDRCPMVTAFTNGICSDVGNTPNPNYRGATFGDNARCFLSNQQSYNTQLAAGVYVPTCQKVYCGGGVFPGRAVVRVGKSFNLCGVAPDNLWQRVYPPNFRGQAPEPVSGVAQTISWLPIEEVGAFRCGDIASQCAPSATTSVPTLDAATFPQILTVSPNNASIGGGARVTITGVALNSCQGVAMGGVFMENLTHPDAGTIVGQVGAVTSTDVQAGLGGGPSNAGIGAVDVVLWCNVTTLCPEGCSVGRLTGAFNYTERNSRSLLDALNLNAAKDFLEKAKEFFNSPTGKYVAAGVGVVLLILILCCIKQACCSGGGKPPQPNLPYQPQAQYSRGPAPRRRGGGHDGDDMLL